VVIVSVDAGYVDVDVDLEDFDDDDLISEIESRGYEVFEENTDAWISPFTKAELAIIQRLVDSQESKPGSELFFIREKLAGRGWNDCRSR
jgi:hypothetical protein